MLMNKKYSNIYNKENNNSNHKISNRNNRFGNIMNFN